ncbi:aldo/keto reductase [Zhihengliuella flava]|uniref:Aryl-alcohol dehydrogenase-like predicted oxidoreductase n=1 Tax=Zhihengliuella flava TaxID=1285193 RepID=A0A931GIS0_9MICC|nr:aldo/keto reductase [Zhihengliuella flava]MBG6084561.1 aryl-alcohol dehydrogenase-like predicted oxidoreductase [Zhihengliuella flava]
MMKRTLGRTGRDVSVIGLGTWQLGGDWGDVEDSAALSVLDAAYESGVRFFDTADVYGDGRSEATIGRWLAANPNSGVTVATKMGRRVEQLHENYHLDAFRAWNDRSRENLGVDTLDLVQLHCPPTSVYADDAVYEVLDTMVQEGRIANYGVSVETVEEALTAIKRPNVATVQIIVNAFRLKPVEEVLPVAAEAGVGIIARVPLASGLLSGRYTLDTQFAENDHRNFNRHGEAFDVGETFSGVDYATGVQAAGEFTELARQAAPDATPAQVALAWLASRPEISSIIPGARNAEQARANAAAGSLTLPDGFDAVVRELYDARLREAIHPRW